MTSTFYGMTERLQKAGLDADDVYRAAFAFDRMQQAAIAAKIPYAEHWQLEYRPSKAWPWQITDTQAPCEQGEQDISNIFVLDSHGPSKIAAGITEMETCARAFQFAADAAAGNPLSGFIAASRREEPTNAA